MYDYDEQKIDTLKHEGGYRYDLYNLHRERRASDGEAKSQFLYQHDGRGSHSIVDDGAGEGDDRESGEWKIRDGNTGIDNTPDLTELKSRRARDIDPDDYQGGEDEFDEIIKRWKER